MGEKIKGKEFALNILNGISMGVVVSLIPSAILGKLMEALVDVWPTFANGVLDIVNFNMSLLAAMAGFSVGYLFKMNMVQMSSIAGAAMIGSGVIQKGQQGFILSGTGDVINAGVTITIAVILAQIIGDRFKSYTILLLPIVVIIVGGSLGLFTLPYVKAVTGFIGMVIKTFTSLQPILMGILMGISFAVLICSPVSSVAIGAAVGLTGIASGSANLGITAGAFTLAVMGSSVNSVGTVIAHFFGTPKIQMGNMMEKPVIYLPVMLSAGIVGALGAIFNIQGTPMSAGFGFSGLVGPLTAYGFMTPGIASTVILVSLFVVLPICLGFIMRFLFIKKWQLFSPQDLLIETK
ncbi:PTS transporter subunit IIC [Ligilactobacillus apodemi]|uniref:PTS transporter subunit IIC n=1 Tax=Ligilactobacillus apodemi TaxID=307126 RepID=UPI00214AA4AF|nr:PTS sugar transporter subunit IIC [Ligilactobacillus apodemi]MCR1900372.1 PTS sugar transporter subunit IIC [Ligilactobacillus apodemi]